VAEPCPPNTFEMKPAPFHEGQPCTIASCDPDEQSFESSTEGEVSSDPLEESSAIQKREKQEGVSFCINRDWLAASFTRLSSTGMSSLRQF
jgi:hypothetical protein